MYSLCHLCQSVATCDKILERGLGLLGGEAGGAGDQGRGLHHPVLMVHAPELGEVIRLEPIPGQLLLHQAHDLHLRQVWGRGDLCKSGTVTAASLGVSKV